MKIKHKLSMPSSLIWPNVGLRKNGLDQKRRSDPANE